MYEKIKTDIAQEYYLKNYPNEGQRFVTWYLRNITIWIPTKPRAALQMALEISRLMPLAKIIDLFPRTDKSYKILWTYSPVRIMHLKTTTDLFPCTENHQNTYPTSI